MSRGIRWAAGRASLVMVAFIAFALVASPALGLSRTGQRLNLRSQAAQAQNNSLRYLHTTWFAATYRYQQVAVNTLTEVPGTAESQAAIEVLYPPARFGKNTAAQIRVRQQASAAYATALALANGTYSSSRTGVTRAQALRRVVAWDNALAISHARDGWGQSWQSALWVYYLGASSKKVWSSLPTCTQELVSVAVAEEADHLLEIPPPTYRNAAGAIVTPGDSKSEENGWNAALLYMAARMWSDNPHAAQWEDQARRYAITAYASPNQVGADPRITGSNINADGTVVNHRIIHPDYMATCGEMLIKDRFVAAWTSTALAPEFPNGFSRVWRALTRLKFSTRRYARPGGTIYRTDSHGTPVSSVYYPQGTGWSRLRKHNHALMDVTAFLFRVDSSAYGRARAHLSALIAQQRRHKNGSIFSRGESYFTEEEQFGAVCAAEMVEGLSLGP